MITNAISSIRILVLHKNNIFTYIHWHVNRFPRVCNTCIMLCKQRGDDQIDASKCKGASPFKICKSRKHLYFPCLYSMWYCNMYLTIIASWTNFNPKGKMTRGLKPITVCHFGRRISYLTDILYGIQSMVIDQIKVLQ